MKGIVASTAGLALLLNEGIGDTIRVSLTPEPGAAARARGGGRAAGPPVDGPALVPAPGVGVPGLRPDDLDVLPGDGPHIQDHIKDRMPAWRETYPGVEEMNVAVMGCVVNGPGESKHADIGISLPGTFEEPVAPVFVDGKLDRTLRGDAIVAEFIDMLEAYVERATAAPASRLTAEPAPARPVSARPRPPGTPPRHFTHGLFTSRSRRRMDRRSIAAIAADGRRPARSSRRRPVAARRAGDRRRIARRSRPSPRVRDDTRTVLVTRQSPGGRGRRWHEAPAPTPADDRADAATIRAEVADGLDDAAITAMVARAADSQRSASDRWRRPGVPVDEPRPSSAGRDAPRASDARRAVAMATMRDPRHVAAEPCAPASSSAAIGPSDAQPSMISSSAVDDLPERRPDTIAPAIVGDGRRSARDRADAYMGAWPADALAARRRSGDAVASGSRRPPGSCTDRVDRLAVPAEVARGTTPGTVVIAGVGPRHRRRERDAEPLGQRAAVSRSDRALAGDRATARRPRGPGRASRVPSSSSPATERSARRRTTEAVPAQRRADRRSTWLGRARIRRSSSSRSSRRPVSPRSTSSRNVFDRRRRPRPRLARTRRCVGRRRTRCGRSVAVRARGDREVLDRRAVSRRSGCGRLVAAPDAEHGAAQRSAPGPIHATACGRHRPRCAGSASTRRWRHRHGHAVAPPTERLADGRRLARDHALSRAPSLRVHPPGCILRSN